MAVTDLVCGPTVKLRSDGSKHAFGFPRSARIELTIVGIISMRCVVIHCDHKRWAGRIGLLVASWAAPWAVARREH